MNEKLREPIDRINEEHATSGSDDSGGPFLFTAVLCLCMIVVMVWLFVPGRVATVRARPAQTHETTITAPPAQEVHQQLEGRTPDHRRDTANTDHSARPKKHIDRPDDK